MNSFFGSDLLWWITCFDMPVLGGLFWLIWRVKKDSETLQRHLHETLEVRCSQLREALAAFKLEVAKGYASVSDLKDLESRLVSHLLRIEAKLDRTALKAEAIQVKSKD